jgi:pyrroloquinoline quinone biosynthesis protein B
MISGTKRRNLPGAIILCLLFYCVPVFSQAPYVLVLGIAQDGGYPHMGCEKECCTRAWKDNSLKRFVVSLALVDPAGKKWWLFEASPDIKEQLQYFKSLTNGEYNYLPEGIFITHAHMGHYTGLMQLGREALNAREVPVYALPQLKKFLETHGPWSQLAGLKNISLMPLDTAKTLQLGEGIFIRSFTVPHRDEFSETAGFKITAGKTSYLFIPDIDKWHIWNKNILEEVKKADIAFLDGTFSTAAELNNRKIEEVPHPFISETMDLLKDGDERLRSRICFIHFNHTNPVIWDANARLNITEQGFGLAEQGKKY